MYGVTANSSGGPSRKRKANAGELKFTFKEAKKVLKTSVPKRCTTKDGGSVESRKKELERERIANDTKQLLTRLGVSAVEQDTFVSLSESCNIGKQELNKHSLQTLFGDVSAESWDARGARDRSEYFANSDDDYDNVADGTSSNGCHARFLKRAEVASSWTGASAATNGYGKTAKIENGTNHVYFLTLAVGTSNATGKSSTRTKQDTVFLCLPPRNGTQHDLKNVNQERLADLMIMKLCFVVRFIYKRLREEISTCPVNKGSQRWRFPVIIVRRVCQTGTGGTWYKMLKEKIVKGEEKYARELSLNFYCNVI